MGKKQKTKPSVATDAAKALTHSPFAALTGAAPADSNEPERRPNAAASETDTPRAAKSRGRLVLRRETKHRGGKPVVVVGGFDAALDDSELETLASRLKRTLGCGGTIETDKGRRELVLQGDQPAKVAEWLRAQGFRVVGVTA